MTRKHVLVVANPKSGNRPSFPLVKRLLNHLRDAGFPAETVELPAYAERREELSAAGTLHAVVCAGGDGTVAAVANRSSPETSLAVFPLGTENLLAKQLGISRNPLKVAEMVKHGTTVRFDAGLANGRLFIQHLGCGFDAEVVRRMEQWRKGHIERWSYFKPIWEAMRNYPYPEIRIQIEEGDALTTEGLHARWVFVFNFPRYAAGIRPVPGARPDDGLLDLCLLRGGDQWSSARYATCFYFGWQARLADYAVHRVKRLRLEGEGQVPFQCDGDGAGFLPVEISVAPRRLCFFVPPAYGGAKP